MSSQLIVHDTDVFGSIPAMLIVLTTIPALLGVVANVAWA